MDIPFQNPSLGHRASLGNKGITFLIARQERRTFYQFSNAKVLGSESQSLMPLELQQLEEVSPPLFENKINLLLVQQEGTQELIDT